MARVSWQREAVLEALRDNGGFASAQTLFTGLKESGIGLATVYRALASFADAGRADTLLSPEGETLYRACESGEHHHHLICRECGKTVEIDSQKIESWAARTAAEFGFSAPEHVIDIFGLCADCTRVAAHTIGPAS